MTPQEEQEMHALAQRLATLTEGTGWEALRYWSIGRTMQQLLEYVNVAPLQPLPEAEPRDERDGDRG